LTSGVGHQYVKACPIRGSIGSSPRLDSCCWSSWSIWPPLWICQLCLIYCRAFLCLIPYIPLLENYSFFSWQSSFSEAPFLGCLCMSLWCNVLVSLIDILKKLLMSRREMVWTQFRQQQRRKKIVRRFWRLCSCTWSLLVSVLTSTFSPSPQIHEAPVRVSYFKTSISTLIQCCRCLFNCFFCVSGPTSLNFGEVCVRSTSQKEISIINNLDVFVHVVIKVCYSYKFLCIHYNFAAISGVEVLWWVCLCVFYRPESRLERKFLYSREVLNVMPSKSSCPAFGCKIVGWLCIMGKLRWSWVMRVSKWCA